MELDADFRSINRGGVAGIMTFHPELGQLRSQAREVARSSHPEAPNELDIAPLDITEFFKAVLELVPPILHACLGHGTEYAYSGNAGGHFFASHLSKAYSDAGESNST
jgi:hypothetical protein